jgi:hypothetical protein
MVIKNLMAAEQTKREGKFLILFSILNFNRSTSARLLLTGHYWIKWLGDEIIAYWDGQGKQRIVGLYRTMQQFHGHRSRAWCSAG